LFTEVFKYVRYRYSGIGNSYLLSIIHMLPPQQGEGDLPPGFHGTRFTLLSLRHSSPSFFGVVLSLYPWNVPFFVPGHPYGFKPLLSALSSIILNLQHFFCLPTYLNMCGTKRVKLATLKDFFNM